MPIILFAIAAVLFILAQDRKDTRTVHVSGSAIVIANGQGNALGLLVGGVAQIPKEPDFSGEWLLVEATGTASDPAPALIVRQTITRTTRRGEPMAPYFDSLTVERHFKSGVESESYKIGTIGGTVGSWPPGEWATVAVTWQGESLIIRTGKYSGPSQASGPYTEHEEAWSFDPTGRLLITSTDRVSGSQPTTIHLIYRRQPTPVASSLARRACEREVSTLVGTVPELAGKRVRTPKKIHPVNPAYPSLPPNTRVKSNTWVGEILLDATGTVSHVWTIREMQFIPPFPAFNRAVVDAVWQWRFEPAMIDGKAIPFCMTTSVLVDFE
jgi:hypothetical protein